MTYIDAAKLVSSEGVQLMRPKPGVPGEFDVKPAFSGKKKGWFYLDSFTASAMLAVYNALSPENQARVTRIPLPKYIDFCWKNVA